jgi:hypothetical protein
MYNVNVIEKIKKEKREREKKRRKDKQTSLKNSTH